MSLLLWMLLKRRAPCTTSGLRTLLRFVRPRGESARQRLQRRRSVLCPGRGTTTSPRDEQRGAVVLYCNVLRIAQCC